MLDNLTLANAIPYSFALIAAWATRRRRYGAAVFWGLSSIITVILKMKL